MNITWIAQFKDGTIIRQYDDEEQTKEHMFKEVLARQDDLAVFNLTNRLTGKLYRLDLSTGNLYIVKSGSFATNPEPDIVLNKKVRLIYFRRMKKDMTFNDKGEIDSQGEPEVVAHFLGCQWNGPDNTNRKLLVQIQEDDQIHIHAE